MIKVYKAEEKDLEIIMEICKEAKEYQRLNNNNQWNQKEEYPNLNTFKEDLLKEQIYLCEKDKVIIGFFILMKELEEDYQEIDGKWLSNYNYASIHRVCLRNGYHHQNLGVEMLEKALELAITYQFKSVRCDTHKDNIGMQKTLEKLGFKKCGIITLKRSKTDRLRLAYEKLI